MMTRFFLFIFIFLTSILTTGTQAFPVTVFDETNTKFTIMSEPKRIVSTMPSNTEMLFALGLEKKLVGVTTACNYPREARQIPKIGGASINVERILSKNPDIIFMFGDAQKMQVDKLRYYGLPVFVINPHTLNDVPKSILLMGKITGANNKAESLAKDFLDKMADISGRKKTDPRPKVLVVLYTDPLLTAGKGTFVNDLVDLAGGLNIGAEGKGTYPSLSFEQILVSDPDYIIVSGKSKTDIDFFRKSKKWSALRAVSNNKIMLIDSDIITRPSLRLVQSLDLICRFLNPGEE